MLEIVYWGNVTISLIHELLICWSGVVPFFRRYFDPGGVSLARLLEVERFTRIDVQYYTPIS
jgi:hypothetical protein